VGGVDDARLGALYASCMLFCFPSLDEGFGLTPLEAMAAGAPILVSRVPALVETCGDAAEYVDHTDAAAIGAAIDALANDTARRAVLHESGLRRARSFTWKRSAEQLLASVRAAVEAKS